MEMAVSNEAVAWVEEAEALLAARDLRGAERAFGRAAELGVDANRCSAGRWMAAMLGGDFEAAWRESDAIRSRGGHDPHRFWTGEELQGRRVMVRSLHGLGDAMQMLRYAPRLREMAASVIWEVAPDLVELARCCADVDEVITWGADAPAQPPEWEVQVEVMELPYLFRTTREDLPIEAHYVHVPEHMRLRAKRAMGGNGRIRVGVCSAASEWDVRRTVSPDELAPVLAENGVEFWCMDRTCGLRENRRLRNVRDECGDGLMMLAAVIANLDLVITVDTLAAHLAGALGTPGWVMLQHAADWRWMVERNDSPWYPSLRLFRQRRPGDWGDVVKTITEELKGMRDLRVGTAP